MWFWWRTESVSSFDTRSPTPHKNFLNTFSAFAYFATCDGIKTRHETRVFDHECHQFSRVATNTEELETILLNKGLESRVSSYSDSMSVSVLENLSQSDKGLNISARSHNLDDDIEFGWWCLSGQTSQARRDICRRKVRLFRLRCKLTLKRWSEKVCKPPVLSIDINIDSTIA